MFERKPFDRDERLKIVAEYQAAPSSGGERLAIAKKHNISQSLIADWIKRYVPENERPSPKRVDPRHLADHEGEEILRQIAAGISASQAIGKSGRSKSAFYAWRSKRTKLAQTPAPGKKTRRHFTDED